MAWWTISDNRVYLIATHVEEREGREKRVSAGDREEKPLKK